MCVNRINIGAEIVKVSLPDSLPCKITSLFPNLVKKI